MPYSDYLIIGGRKFGVAREIVNLSTSGRRVICAAWAKYRHRNNDAAHITLVSEQITPGAMGLSSLDGYLA